jgi:hypothetical protein
VRSRQRTLLATIEWSYALLDEDEKTLFNRLGVFRGGAALEAVEAVCGRSLVGSLLDNLSRLVEKSLVVPRDGSDGELRGRRQSHWFARLHAERPNFNSALAWSLEGDSPEYGVRMAISLADYWYFNGLSV